MRISTLATCALTSGVVSIVSLVLSLHYLIAPSVDAAEVACRPENSDKFEGAEPFTGCSPNGKYLQGNDCVTACADLDVNNFAAWGSLLVLVGSAILMISRSQFVRDCCSSLCAAAVVDDDDSVFAVSMC